jgi:hypothetical protein
VLIGLIEGDRNSFLNIWPSWHPTRIPLAWTPCPPERVNSSDLRRCEDMAGAGSAAERLQDCP